VELLLNGIVSIKGGTGPLMELCYDGHLRSSCFLRMDISLGGGSFTLFRLHYCPPKRSKLFRVSKLLSIGMDE